MVGTEKKLPIFSIRSIFIFIFVIIIAPHLFAAKSEVQILQADNHSVLLQIALQLERIDTVAVNGASFLKIQYRNALLTGEPGNPWLPRRVVSVGIPQTGDAHAEIIASEFEEISGTIVPAPLVRKDGTLDFSAEKSVSGSESPRVIHPLEPAFFRNQRILPVEIFPVQYNSSRRTIRLLKKLQIRVSFSGTAVTPSVAPIRDKNEEEFYKDVIANFSQSKKWLKQHSQLRTLKKPVLQGGEYIKITVQNEGFYKISGADLAAQAVDLSAIVPATLRIYNNGGRELPRDIRTPRPDSLIENAIYVSDGGDGKFDSEDYLIFYGVPVEYWDSESDTSQFFSHYINHYTTKNVYWLKWGDGKTGKRIQTRRASSDPNVIANLDFYGRHFEEDEINNFLHSGLDWFGRLLAGNQTQNYSAYLPAAENTADNLVMRIRFYGLTSSTHRISIYVNDQLFATHQFLGSRFETIEKTGTVNFSESGYNSIKIQYNGNNAESQMYLDWFELFYKKKFEAEDSYLWFMQSASGAQKYRVTGFSSNDIHVFDVTDRFEIAELTGTEISSGTVTFVDDSSDTLLRQYVALTPEAYRTPASLEKVNVGVIRSLNDGADFLIITHDDFYNEILPLKELREQMDSVSTQIVKISDVYNEFSWGLTDPTAIRDFIKYAFDNWYPQPKYVLLCGDGDYDYKNLKGSTDKNWIPPFETTEMNENSSRATDDWYVMVSGNDAAIDLAIGRFPVQSAEEVRNVVQKIIDYENSPLIQSQSALALDDWRNVVTMVGDDEITNKTDNETQHTRDAEDIIENLVPDSFEKQKIYLIEYPAERDPSTSGIMKPAATAALLDCLNKGTLIVNYIGHGNPTLWAHERLLKQSRDLALIQNEHRLPFWIAATCDFGRFDDPLEQAFSEELFTEKDRGGIGFLSSTRLAYADLNTALNRLFYVHLFNGQQPTERIAVALMKAKLANYSVTNDQKYHIFGDPTMRLRAPRYSAHFTKIQPDTLKALSKIRVEGYLGKSENAFSNFQGKALLKVYDSKQFKIYYTVRNSQIRYYSPGKTIFRGNVSAKNGHFAAEFIVPKDITYGGNLGRISIYFADQQIQGVGYRDSVPVGGTSFLKDEQGPEIRISFEGTQFSDGKTVPRNSVLEVELADSVSGINIVGDIGHNITMTLDDLEAEKIVLTDYFNYYENNFQAGKALYDFSTHKLPASLTQSADTPEYGLPLGTHTITVKAWDNFNNSSVKTATFQVVSEDELVLQDVFNYPNPFSSSTTFTFYASQQCEVKIKIYTTRGTLIQTLEGIVAEAAINQVYWDGLDRDGDELANGVYLYKVIARAPHGDKTIKAEKIGKLVISR
ncbi:MAG: type IX secretion system sortase PorU [Calditrichaeota bacterium]|nr:type IX secretion system sortase PorU [Calditrichota bacterium]